VSPPRDAVAISPDSTRVVYVADQDTDGVVELYSAPIDGSTSPAKLNGPMVPGGDVGIYFPLEGELFAPPQISADGGWVVYRANEDVVGRFDLYAAPIGGGPSTRLNPALSSVEVDYAITGDSRHAVYRARSDPTRGPQLHAATLTGSFQVTQLNSALVEDGSVHSFELSGGTVTYRADQDEVDAVELFLSLVVRTRRLLFPAPVGPQ
jgi:Tol biopolymer transport system component